MAGFDFSPLSDFIEALRHDLGTGRFAWELGVLAAAILLGWLLAHALCKRVRPGPGWKFGAGDFERVAIPLFIYGFTVLGKIILARYQPVSLLEIVDTLLLAWFAIRIAVYVLGHVLPPGAFLRSVIRVIAWVAWIAVALQVTGTLADVLEGLDAVGFNTSKDGGRVTLLLILKGVIALALTITVALWISRITESRVLAADTVQMSTRMVVTKVVRVSTLFIAVMVALPLVGIDITALSVFSGALGVGLGFGLQKIAANYVSGFIVLLDRSLKIGDVVTITGIRGEVKAIETRYTVLRALDGNEAIIPNETLIAQNVIHHNFSDPNVTVNFEVAVSYESDVDMALELLEQIARRQPRLVSEPAPSAKVKRLADSGVELELTGWIKDPGAGEGDLRSAVLRDILRTFRAKGIAIPYPTREVRLIATPETAPGPAKQPIGSGT
jgi:small-conductance mechanosensitive channel